MSTASGLRLCFLVVVFGLVAVARRAEAASGRKRKVLVSIAVPSVRTPWQPTRARIRVRNRTRKMIVPLSLELYSKAGKLKEWGYKGTDRRWVIRRRAQKRAGSYRIVGFARVGQRAIPRPDRPKSNSVMAELSKRLKPGESMHVSHSFQAAYSHGGVLKAKLTFLTLEPARMHLCRYPLTKAPIKVFPCHRVEKMSRSISGDRFFVPWKRLSRPSGTATAKARFRVRRPKWRLSAARRKAGMPKGPGGYARKMRRWVLVTPNGERTEVVGRRGKTLRLPGSWLSFLMGFNGSREGTITWAASSPREARLLRAELIKQGLEVEFFSFKGHESKKRLIIRVRLSQVGKLGRLMREKGARLKGMQVRR